MFEQMLYKRNYIKEYVHKGNYASSILVCFSSMFRKKRVGEVLTVPEWSGLVRKSKEFVVYVRNHDYFHRKNVWISPQ